MRRLISLAVSAALLAIIYASIDAGAMIAAFRQSSIGWLAAGLGMVVPLTALTSLRLQRLLPSGAGLSFGEALRLTLSASVLNMVLPSKLGDLAKGFFIRDRGHLPGPLAFALVVFEKACDLLALLAWCVLGLLLLAPRSHWFAALAAVACLALLAGTALLVSERGAALLFHAAARVAPGRLRTGVGVFGNAWRELQAFLQARRGRSLEVAAGSLVIWFLHLLQIWLFVLALRAWVPLLANLALAPLAILAGLVPFTFAGVGTRDAALIVAFRDYLAAPTAAALGVLCTMRYLMPALAGLPFLGGHVQQLRLAQRGGTASSLEVDRG